MQNCGITLISNIYRSGQIIYILAFHSYLHFEVYYQAFKKRFETNVFTQLKHQFQKLYIRQKTEEIV